MPELPEVETVVRQLQKRVQGHKILEAKLQWKKTLRSPSEKKFLDEIKEKLIEKVERKGKYIVFNLSQNKHMIIHLRMTGNLIVKNSQEGTPVKNNYIRAVFKLNKDKKMLFSDIRKFGTIDFLDKKELQEKFKKIGPDPLQKTVNKKYLQNIFKKINKEIKKVLLEQNIISGIGNIYADEILFDAKISPKKPAKKLTSYEIKNLLESMRGILKKAIEKGGTTFSDFKNIDEKEGNYGKLTKVYRRENLNCARCGHKIKKEKIGGRQTRYCPACQK